MQLFSSDHRITVHWDDRTLSCAGFFLSSSRRVIRIRLNHSSRGVLDFKYFLIRKQGERGRLCLFHLRKGKPLYRACFSKTVTLNSRKLYLRVKKGDELLFRLEGRAVAAVTRPLFYRPVEREKAIYVFLIAVDTLRRDKVGAYNPSVNFTPAMDRLARDGVVYLNAYSTAPWTLPAFISFFTGKDTVSHGIHYRENTDTSSLNFLMEDLSHHFFTYATTADMFLTKVYGFNRGFDIFIERIDDAVSERASRDMFREVMKELEEHAFPAQIYFMHTYQVHNVYISERELVEKKLGWKLKKWRVNILNFMRYGKDLCRKASKEKKEEIEMAYNAAVFTFDYHLGRFLDFLKKLGIYRNSLIILFSDHGEEFADHGCWEHGHSLYNELINIPLILKLPGNRRAGTKEKALVSITDILPTLFDYYGISFNGKIDGISLLEADNQKHREILAYLAPYSLRFHVPEKACIINRNYKVIYNHPLSQADIKFFHSPPSFPTPYEVYDIEKDPFEKNPIKKFTPEVEILKRHLKKAMEKAISRTRKSLPERLKKRLKSLGYL